MVERVSLAQPEPDVRHVRVKACSRCKQELPVEQFGTDRRVKDGYNQRCKRCRNTRLRSMKVALDPQYAARVALDVEAASSGLRRCTKCNQIKDAGQFNRYARNADGLHKRCRACMQVYDRAHYQQHPTRAAYIAALGQVRRAQKAGSEMLGDISRHVLREILVGSCVYCGARATTVDHVNPLIHGGWHDVWNLVPACGTCNASKCGRLLTEWDPVKVQHAVRVSRKVAAEWGILQLVSSRKVELEVMACRIAMSPM